MTLVLLLLIPLLTGILSFGLKGAGARTLALLSALATLGLAAYTAFLSDPSVNSFSAAWMPAIGASFSLHADGLSAMLVLLTALVQVVVMIVNQQKEVESPGSFYGLMMLSQAGLIGVFLAADGLLFYFFWELALVPVYFLCSRWGGERRIPVTFKFFVYTFAGSLMLLAGLIYVYLQTPGSHSYAWADLVATGKSLDGDTQIWLFWLFFGAFAIKMPIFPFHTWQPDTYEQSPTPVTIILSALMVKMGIYAVLRWLLPVLPEGAAYWSHVVVILSVTGIIYASCLAMVQTDIKRLVAYSSIAHMGLMAAAAFSSLVPGPHPELNTSIHGLYVQMFNHGINITGMWLLADMAESRFGTRDMSRMGGMARFAPWMAVTLLIISLANIALPLTNGFIGEFLLFNGLFQSGIGYHMVYMAIAGLGIILGAVYTLSMVQKVAYGQAPENNTGRDLTTYEWIATGIILVLILFLGIYPKPLLDLTAIL